jgi:hypothetical protein
MSHIPFAGSSLILRYALRDRAYPKTQNYSLNLEFGIIKGFFSIMKNSSEILIDLKIKLVLG